MINNRQAGRRRGRGGQQQRPQGNSGRQDNGNRIDNRARGNAAQLLEKYKSLARDSQMQGDRVNTEYYLQFADHYFRVLAETRSRFEENRRQNGGPAFDSGFDSDDQEYDDDSEPVARVEQQPRQDAPRHEGQRNDNQRAEASRYEGQRGDQRNEAPRGDGQRGDNQRGDSQRNDNQRNEGQRGNSQRGDARRGESGTSRDTRNQRDAAETPADQGRGNPTTEAGEYEVAGQSVAGEVSFEEQGRLEVSSPNGEGAERPARRGPRAAQATPVESDVGEVSGSVEVLSEQATPAEAPRRRGRPRRVVETDEAPLFEADRLPPALGVSMSSEEESVEEKPRRRRGRPAATETSSAT